MTRTTIVEYKQIVAKLGAEVEALRVQVAEQSATIEALKAQRPARTWGPRPSAYVPPQPSPEVLKKRAAMAFAREYAVANHRSITLAEAERLMAQG